MPVTEVYVFAEKLVQIFSLALGLEETALDEFFKLPFTDITINHYPPQAGDDMYKQVLYPHADYGGEYPLTLPVGNPDELTIFWQPLRY